MSTDGLTMGIETLMLLAEELRGRVAGLERMLGAAPGVSRAAWSAALAGVPVTLDGVVTTVAVLRRAGDELAARVEALPGWEQRAADLATLPGRADEAVSDPSGAGGVAAVVVVNAVWELAQYFDALQEHVAAVEADPWPEPQPHAAAVLPDEPKPRPRSRRSCLFDDDGVMTCPLERVPGAFYCSKHAGAQLVLAQTMGLAYAGLGLDLDAVTAHVAGMTRELRDVVVASYERQMARNVPPPPRMRRHRGHRR